MKRTIRILFSSIVKGCFAGVLTLIFAPPLARAQLFTLSSITGWWDYDTTYIREVDPATGATISFKWIILPPGTYGAYTTGMAAHPTTGEFLALVESAPSPTGPICQHLLAKIDPATGAATIIGNTGDCFASLAFHGNGTLYGVTNSEGAVPPSLFTLDTTSATPTFLISFDTVGVSSGAVVGGSGLAFNPSDGLLYRSGRVDDSDQIFQAIDPDTLAVIDIPLSGSPTDEIIALTHFFENTLLGADVGNRLFSITTEGVRTLIGPMDHLPRGLVFASTALNLTQLTANVPSPQPSGTPITFSATAMGGTSPIEFKWWLRTGGVWSVAQDWSTNNTFSWTPAVGGGYGIGVWARSSGNVDDASENNAFAGMNFSIDDSCSGCWDY